MPPQRLSLTDEHGRKDQGIFEALLGDPRALFQDLIDDPSRYGPEVSALIQEMMAGKQLSELTDDERAMLDAATVEFAQAPPPKPPEVKTAKRRPRRDPWEL